MLTFDEAEAACVHGTGDDRKQFCVDNVLATDDTELVVNDSLFFYHHK